MKISTKAFIMLSLFSVLLLSYPPSYSQPKLHVTETRKIYDNNSYCAFTSLIDFNGKYYCTFREASSHHIKFDDPNSWGKIVLLESNDAKEWRKVAEFRQDSTDMRDPKIRKTPNGKQLMLLYHKHRILPNNNYTGGNSVVRIFNNDDFTAVEQDIIVKGNEKERVILWNSTSRGRKHYGFITGSKCMFVSSTDGVNYKVITDLTDWSKANNGVTETHVAFYGMSAYVVVRMSDDQGFFGESKYPFMNWNWTKMNISVGGPNLFRLNRTTLLLGSRDYGNDKNRGKTALYKLTKGKWANSERIMVLDSTNDSSYPCFLKIDDKHLMVSYYSGTAQQSNIYIADIVIE